MIQALDDNDENNGTLWTAESLSWLSSDIGETSASTVEGPASRWDVCIAILFVLGQLDWNWSCCHVKKCFFLRSTLRRRRLLLKTFELHTVDDMQMILHPRLQNLFFTQAALLFFNRASTQRKYTLKFAFSYTGIWIVNSRLAKHNLNSTNSFCQVLYFVIRAILLAVAECTDVHVFYALCVQTNEIVQPCFSMTIFYRNFAVTLQLFVNKCLFKIKTVCAIFHVLYWWFLSRCWRKK